MQRDFSRAQGCSSALRRLVLAIAMSATLPAANAFEFSWSGFANVNLGRTFGNSGLSDQDWGYPQTTRWTRCPCYIVDFSHASMYENRWSLAPETRVGLQGTLNFNDQFSATAQTVLRTEATDAKLVLETAYLTYNLTPRITAQAGRKRLPLFYYSDFQDVSFAYNWVRVPPDMYGWAVVNYDGFNLTYRDTLGSWAVKSNVYVGSEKDNDNLIGRLGDEDRRRIEWKNMRGIDVELTYEWFSTRLAINKSSQRRTQFGADGTVTLTPDPGAFGRATSPQTFTSLAFNVDDDNLVVRSEFLRVDRKPVLTNYKGYLVGVGYRIGKFLPMLTYSELKAYAIEDFNTLEETDDTLAATLRYQLSDTSSLKLQVERSRWELPDGASRTRKLVTLGFDITF